MTFYLNDVLIAKMSSSSSSSSCCRNEIIHKIGLRSIFKSVALHPNKKIRKNISKPTSLANKQKYQNLAMPKAKSNSGCTMDYLS
jgi:hypothetical protein